MTRGFSANDENYLLLPGPDDATIFLFIHGYGSAPQDLLPLARHINNQGYSCALLLLKGHGGESAAMTGLQYSDFLQQVKEFYYHYKATHKTIYLVGFSFGATLSLHIAREEQVAGVVAISTFLRPPSFTLAIMRLASLLGFRRVPRLLQVTSRKTKKEIFHSKHFLVAETLALIETIPSVTAVLMPINCPVLFLHSVDDKVADYWTVAALAKTLPCPVFLVTFRCLKHFLHFDAPLPSWFQLIDAFFWSTKSPEISPQPDLFKEAWARASDEFRHWSGIIFQLLVGFFTIFGGLIYFSLPAVLAKEPGAPYYLEAYSILTSFFFVLFALYFFYINRVNVFVKHQIEPYLSGPSWTAYRTSRVFAGKESERMTERSFLAVVGLPLAISVGSVVYALIEYSERLFSFKRVDILLTLGITVAIILIFSSLSALLTLSRYTRRELYRLPVFKAPSGHLQAAVQALYLSVSPGVVSQDAGDKRPVG